ncbi:hypoxanthine phosphoribosyltransferase [Spiroplasma chinense]|uniref:Hypoxanthine phosphoribosyltransferase n=1 Tax=Spiroplasma chinense TaxID=216932 RepID=A0A5B9Y442_9MOLU|nr:hypoxanthine phosphoribosyltransferase [Spiroplasma chinense]QEH61533.1 hypoxanthine phosphoribosyltransferase [Spiroplasma chinense]
MKHELVKEILYTKEQIDVRTKELAEEISKFYETQEVKDNTVILIGLLKGCVPFMANFLNNFTYECQTEYMVVSSYLGGTKTSGEPKINLDLNLSIKDKTILIVEDIVDSGLTLDYVKKYLYFKGARDVKILTMLDKPEGRKVEMNVEWSGFTIQNQFVIGYGLDYEERLRNLPYVAICDTDKLKDWKW